MAVNGSTWFEMTGYWWTGYKEFVYGTSWILLELLKTAGNRWKLLEIAGMA